MAQRLWVFGEVEGSWVKGSRSKIGSWVRRSVRRSTKSKAWSGLWVRGVIWALGSPVQSKAWSGLSLLPLSLSLSLSLFARKSGNCLKWKFWLKPISGSKPLKHTVNWKYFPENLFSMRNQTLAFTEKHFRKWFEAKTNTAYIYEREGKWMQWMKLLWNIRFILLFESFNRRNWNVIFMFECEEMKWIKENTHFSIFIFPSKFKILFPPKFWSNWNEWNDILVWW